MSSAMKPSMEDSPAFPRSPISPLTIAISPSGSADMELSKSANIPAVPHDSQLCANLTPSASRQAHNLFKMLIGEHRSRKEREQKGTQDKSNKIKKINRSGLGSSAELGGRTKSKSSKPFKSLFSVRSAGKTSTSRKSRRLSNLYPRLGLFSGSRKSNATIPHAQPIPDQARPLIQPRIPGTFVPALPAEVWLLILKYAAYPPFVDLPTTSPQPVSPLNPSYDRQYPYPTTYDPHSEAVSFMHHPTAHAHLSERLAAYRAQMRAKAALRYVCRAWSMIAHEVLYEFIWVASAKEGRELAGKLCGDMGGAFIGASVSVGGKENENGKEKQNENENERSEREGKGSFGRKWLGKQKEEIPTADSSSVMSRKSSSHALAPPSVGRWIKRLHVETRALERCSPHDLLLILQHCPNLEEYSDYKSVRRPMHPLMLSLSDVAPFSVGPDDDNHTALVARQREHQQALLTPDALLYNLLSRPLRRLTWTNYDYDATDFEAGLRFYEDIVAPRLETMGQHLEFLELVLSGTATHGMGQRSSNGWGVGGACSEEVRGDVFGPGRLRAGVSPTLFKNPSQSMYGAANMLTQLEASYTSTSVTADTSSLLSAPMSLGGSQEDLVSSVDGFTYALCLPSLRTLKATLDNATFLVLSTWDMPEITHLSIVSADFGYAAPGFRRFFEVHGSKLKQLELGHSSGAIEEAWITEPSTVQDLAQARSTITLEAWCPALTEFICSADAEWNWQRPDWIAPHVLLPSHAGVQFIGVRDMEKRLMSDLDEALRRRRGDGWRHREGSVADFDNIEGWDNWGDEDDERDPDHREDDPYFALLQQFGSLLCPEAFPSLLYVRDMSWESDIMRRTGSMRPLPPSATPVTSSPPPPEPLPLETARHNPYSTSTFSSAFMSTSTHQQPQHWWNAAIWAQTVGPKKGASKESAAQVAAREAEEALARAYGRRLNVFWRRVVRMCRQRGVWLEDCFGVNVTKANLRQAVVQ